jgi:hypothetical protein
MKGAKPPPTSDQGIKGLWLDIERATKQAEADGEQLFRLVTEQEVTPPDAFNGLIYQASLRELIFYTLDHRKEITTGASSQKSLNSKALKTHRDEGLVVDWCNQNTPKAAKEPYRTLIPKVAAATNIRARTTVRRFVSLWRKKYTRK